MALGAELRAATADHGVPLIVDERVDVALALGADGVHVGQVDMPPAAVRALLGPDRILGVTVDLSNPASIEEAVSATVRADYVGSNAVYPRGRDGSPPTRPVGASDPNKELIIGLFGLAKTRRLLIDAAVAAGLTTPPALVAIGGITTRNAAATLAEGGADGVAVVSAILSAKDPAVAAREIRNALS